MKWLKWIGVALGSLLILLLAVVIIMLLMANRQLNRTYDITPTALYLPTDSQAIAHGQHIAKVLCNECHGGAYEGKMYFDEMPLARVYTSNLTPGEGGVGSYYTDEDWVRAIRHGVNPEGRGLFLMPSQEYHHMGEKDLGSLIAYLKTLQPVDKVRKDNEYGYMGKLLLVAGAFGDIISAAAIDHKADFSAVPTTDVSIEYGEYLVNISGCRTCHMPHLGGGKSPNPNSPYVPNITTSGNLGDWSETDFLVTMNTGKTPEGAGLQEKFMPWTSYAHFTADELRAIYVYLNDVQPAKTE